MPFWSDNTAAVAPEILTAMTRVNDGIAPSYGADLTSAGLDDLFSEVFETPVSVFPVVTGTAANALAMALLAPPYGAVFCHEEAHLHVDECGAPEFFTGGVKLVSVPGRDGRIDPVTLEARIAALPAGVVHHVQPAAVTLSQATECGTAYTPDEVAAIARVARDHGLGVHMDGARIANAIAALGCAPADVTWRAGVDVLSFGATKNGAMAAEAIVLFGDVPRTRLPFLRKRAGHLLSKMRFLSVQLDAYLQKGRWLAWAAHANAMARRLADELETVNGVEIAYPVEANEVFALLPAALFRSLDPARMGFHPWSSADRDGLHAIRLVTAFNTRPDEVDRFVDVVRNAGTAAKQAVS